jgi:hypothetical protein
MRQHIGVIFLLLTFCSACNSDEKIFYSTSEQIATRFYETVKAEKFSDITTLLDSSTFVTDPPSNWILLLKNKQKELGKVKTFIKQADKRKLANENELLLKYRVVYEKGSTFELIGIRLINHRVFITQYQYGNSEAEIESKWFNF